MRCPWLDASGWQSCWPWAAMNGLKFGIFKNDIQFPEQQQKKKKKICLSTQNCDALERNIFVICENYMIRNENLGLKMEVSRATHTPRYLIIYAIHIPSEPPPPPLNLDIALMCDECGSKLKGKFPPNNNQDWVSRKQFYKPNSNIWSKFGQSI